MGVRARLRSLRDAVRRPEGVGSSSFLDQGEDLALLFCTEVLKLESLHWGWWGDVPPSFEGLKAAQTRFSEQLFESIPEEGVTHILDVGCGLGDNARLLAERGYQVTAISPDAHHERYYLKQPERKHRFVRTGIEDFVPDREYDLVLMSESSHFFDEDVGFDKCNEALRDGGYVLTASMFRQRDGDRFTGFHVEDAWTRCAARHGYTVRDRRDVTEQVLPTATLIRDVYQDFVPPLWEITEKVMARASMPARLAFALLVGGQLEELRHYLLEGFVAQVADPELFRTEARYVFVLLERR